MLDAIACPTCGATGFASCTTKTGRQLFEAHKARRLLVAEAYADRQRRHEDAVRPKGPPPYVMEVPSVVDGRVQRFYPVPKRAGWRSRG